MAPSKAPTSWDDEESSGSESSGTTQPVVAARRNKFDDEEDEDVVDDWDAEPDSEEEREKAKKAAAAKAKAEAEAKADHKSKAQRREERIAENMAKKQSLLEDSDEEEETEAEKRARLRETEQASDLAAAEDMFGNIGINPNRSAKPVTVVDDKDPGNAVDLSSMKLFKPETTAQFAKLRETLVPLLNANSKKPQYALFMPEFCKQVSKDLTSDQIKKVASALTTLSNEKLKEEKAADKGGKKTKAAKTKTTLNASRNVASAADTFDYGDDGLDDDDFM
ncbi:translation initiation factor eIF3 subunit [Teratosphaeria nubilosa]|uniref:Eukaryotic translation initiation factor 3 subunit J n=1 Tax=Teratosphaeria nubilosa TaxID=161662 RepID=A0A6G1LBN2_9PEZI|nr:translation initiation factor eIF3 subunit [Teratosphaeria nubilosa]